MTVFANFVRCELAANITAGATSFDVLHAAPYNRPPDPAGSIGRMVIRDSLRVPTAFEVITYTGTTEVDSETTTLTGVTRATEGTTAQAWLEGAVAAQDVTAADLALLALQNQPLCIVGGSEDNSVRKHHVNGTQVWANFDHDDPIRAVGVNSYGDVASLDSVGFLKKIGADGTTTWSADLSATIGIANVSVVVDEAGRVYFGRSVSLAGTASREIACYEAGSEVWSITPGGDVRGIDVDGSGNLFAITSSDGLVMISPEGDTIWEVDPPFTSVAVSISLSPDKRQICVGDVDTVWVFDYGGQVITSFAAPDTPNSIAAISGDLVLVSEPGDNKVALVDFTGTAEWTVDLGLQDADLVCASDVGVIGYIRGDLPNEIQTLDLDGNSLGTIRDYTSPITAIAAARVSPAHAAVYRDGEFKLRRPSYESLADLPVAHNVVNLSTSVVPETPPSGHAYLYFEGTNLVVKWDDGTTDIIATKGP